MIATKSWTKFKIDRFQFSFLIFFFFWYRLWTYYACLIVDLNGWSDWKKKSFRHKTRNIATNSKFKACFLLLLVLLKSDYTPKCIISTSISFLLLIYRKERKNTQTHTLLLDYSNNNHCYIFITNLYYALLTNTMSSAHTHIPKPVLNVYDHVKAKWFTKQRFMNYRSEEK